MPDHSSTDDRPRADHVPDLPLTLRQDHLDALHATVKATARFLLAAGHPELWRALYQEWRAGGGPKGVSDAMVRHFAVDDYQEHDELRYVFGQGWRGLWAEWEANRADNVRRRAALDGDGDDA